jgi:ectoine hydroxylase-related dioxygenase (phytanoyl-CoA dioxygenase family)
MRISKDIPVSPEPPRLTNTAGRRVDVDALVSELEANGIVVLPNLLTAEQLRDMQKAFAVKLRRMCWNHIDGYYKNELYRHMVADVLVLDQGFVDLALHPLVKDILNSYMGTNYELTEAKGWKSLPTTRDFHGWHADAWYDQTSASEIHREVKLAFYLTDVRTGAFNYIKGSHRRQHPRILKKQEVNELPASRLVELNGPEGTAFLFDSSGIHSQGMQILEPRQAIFFNYHDPRVRLDQENITYYRYHPLILNAEFLGNLSAEDQRILGFGNKTNFQPAFEQPARTPIGYKTFNAAFNAQLRIENLAERISARLRRTLRMSG